MTSTHSPTSTDGEEDPDGIPFPEPATFHKPSEPPTGLELLKLWVHEYEAGRRPSVPSNVGLAQDLAGVIGVWEDERAAAENTRVQMESARRRCDEVQREQGVTRSENARLRTAVGQMEEQATKAQARCDEAQDRLDMMLEDRRKAWEVAASRNAENRSLQATVERLTTERRNRPAHSEVIREARGPEHTITKADVEEIAAAVIATKAVPAEGERLVVLSSGSVDKIAQQVAVRLVERVATPSFRAALSALQAGVAGAGMILRSVNE